ncbi:MAG: CBASS oligonucleotide cyclase [Candidatus Tenebribacter mawsonii]|nr:CBASS oligonucleotide cyclase [Candidatus Tenebribacter mawsonii]
MELNNTQLINFREKIKFSNEDKRKYQAQIDNLISSIQTKINEHTDTNVLKVLQAGSWKKGTIIKKMDDNPVDIDLIFFLNIDISNYETFQEINQVMIPILKLIYPNKNDDDFWDNPKTAGLEFISSGLNVDIVPVRDTNIEDYVQQPDINNNNFFTSPKNQLKFISERKEANSSYSTIVRILKKWKNFQELKLSSFAIELIVAHLDINIEVETTIEESLLRFFKFVGQKTFPVITFSAPYGTYKSDNSCIYIADPTYNENNVTKFISEDDWENTREKADTAFDTILLADEEEFITSTTELWKEIFGGEFNINE